MKGSKTTENKKLEMPTVLVPYKGPCAQCNCQEIIVYLRPETNGIQVESTIMRVIEGDKLFKENIKLIYLANLPGSFIVHNKIVEEHYKLRVYFACQGKQVFTISMRKKFEDFFKVQFKDASIIGSFDALEHFNLDEEELFNIWVPQDEMVYINGQSIKKWQGVFIVNYDIPALIHKSNFNTDIAVMIFRTFLGETIFHKLIYDISQALQKTGDIDLSKPVSRIFHYSKSPFEQILDGSGYIYDESGQAISIREISFCKYLLVRGYTLDQVRGLLAHPILWFASDGENVFEDNIMTLSIGYKYKEAVCLLEKTRLQLIIG